MCGRGLVDGTGCVMWKGDMVIGVTSIGHCVHVLCDVCGMGLVDGIGCVCGPEMVNGTYGRKCVRCWL